MSISKTLQIVSRFFWWKTIRKDDTHFVRTCDACQRVKNPTHKPYGLLHPLPIPAKQWSEVTMDFIVELPPTPAGHNAILVFTDKLTKMVHFAPTSTTCTAVDAAQLFVQKVFVLHGLLVRMIHDTDTCFTSHFWEEVFKTPSVQQSNSPAFHPQTDGQTEKVNKSWKTTSGTMSMIIKPIGIPCSHLLSLRITTHIMHQHEIHLSISTIILTLSLQYLFFLKHIKLPDENF
jgi:hypothetical protein